MLVGMPTERGTYNTFNHKDFLKDNFSGKCSHKCIFLVSHYFLVTLSWKCTQVVTGGASCRTAPEGVAAHPSAGGGGWGSSSLFSAEEAKIIAKVMRGNGIWV